MKLVYNIAIKGYSGIISLASLFNNKASLWINGRKNWLPELKKAMGDKKNIYWFHCASLGEFEQGVPLIEALKKQDKSISILITFFSPSGYELKKNYPLADYVCYLPIDSKQNAKNFISELNITKAFFIKYEFWYHYFNELKQNNIPFYMVSSSFRENQLFFQWYGGWFKKILALPTTIFVQDIESKKILKENNIESILSGDTRFDKVVENALKAIKVPLIEKFKNNSKILIAGSSWQPEENILSIYYKTNNKLKLIIAPHDVSKSHIKNIQSLFPKSLLFSEANDSNINTSSVLIIDNIGMLSNLYQYADIAMVGGGFSGALHNILEPATFGIPVLFGNKTEKYREANLMMKNGAGFEFSNQQEFNKIINNFISNNNYLTNQKNKNKAFINSNIGATKTILSIISNR